MGEWLDKPRSNQTIERYPAWKGTSYWYTQSLDESAENYADKSKSQKVTCCLTLFIYHSWYDRILEIETRLVAAGRRRGRREVGVAMTGNRKDGCQREVFCFLAVSVSISGLRYYTIVLQDLPLGKCGKGHMRFLCIISYNCMWIYNFLKNSEKNN